jgi:hypothetical protein
MESFVPFTEFQKNLVWSGSKRSIVTLKESLPIQSSTHDWFDKPEFWLYDCYL